MNIKLNMTYNTVIASLLFYAAAQTSSYGIINIIAQEVGNDVVVSYVGDLNIVALTNDGLRAFGPPGINGTFGNGGFYLQDAETNAHLGATGSGAIGTIGFQEADSSTGDSLTINLNGDNEIGLPIGYNSLTEISGSITYLNTNIDTLGFNIGTNTAVWSWGTGGTADQITFSAIPEPSNLSMMIGLMAMAFLFKYQNKRTKTVSPH